MKTARTKTDLQNILNAAREDGKTVALVPTMGALHDGHLSLVKLAKAHADIVAVSIFVNPTQFAPHEDFNQYPRTPEDDTAKLARAGADIVFLPGEEDIYPDGKDSKIKAGAAAHANLEDRFRPTHFDGVVNVVSRLFDIAKPDAAVFGEKDFQQLCVIREMTETLDLPIRIIGAPIIRDAHGLALSSRNAYLSAEQLEIARTLNKTLLALVTDINSGAEQETAIARAEQTLRNTGFDKIDYIALWNDRILAAAWLGKTRLIDNMAL